MIHNGYGDTTEMRLLLKLLIALAVLHAAAAPQAARYVMDARADGKVRTLGVGLDTGYAGTHRGNDGAVPGVRAAFPQTPGNGGVSARNTREYVNDISEAPAAQIGPAKSPANQASRFEFGLLWRIASTDGPPSFLFGTMHVEDARVTDLPQPVQRAFAASASLTLEAVLDGPAMLSLAPALLLTDGQMLNGIVDADLYARVLAHTHQLGLPELVLARLKPWAVAVLLSQPEIKTGLFLDRKLQIEARQQQKPVYGLETLEEQLAIFNTLTRSEQIQLLEDALEQRELLPQLLEQLTRAYLRRDLKALSELSDRYDTGTAVGQTLKQRVIVERNAKMVERMLPRLSEGGGFIAVGALHLPGPQGVLQMLSDRGFDVTAVY